MLNATIPAEVALPTVDEIAERLHTPKRTVERDLASAIKKLKANGQIHRFAYLVYLSQTERKNACLAH